MSKQEKTSWFKLFNSTYFELLKMMKDNSDKNKDFLRFYKQNLFLKRANVKLFIRTWYTNITRFYMEPILNGNIQFFLEKDYSAEINENKEFSNTYSIESYVQYFKEIYNTLKQEDVDVFVEKVQELTKLSKLYYS